MRPAIKKSATLAARYPAEKGIAPLHILAKSQPSIPQRCHPERRSPQRPAPRRTDPLRTPDRLPKRRTQDQYPPMFGWRPKLEPKMATTLPRKSPLLRTRGLWQLPHLDICEDFEDTESGATTKRKEKTHQARQPDNPDKSLTPKHSIKVYAIFCAQPDCRRRNVLLQMLHFDVPGIGSITRRLFEQPRQRELRRTRPCFSAIRANACADGDPPSASSRPPLGTTAGTDPVLLAVRQRLLVAPVRQTVSILYSHNLHDSPSIFNLCRRYFAQPDVPDLALLLHPLQRAETLFNRCRGSIRCNW